MIPKQNTTPPGVRAPDGVSDAQGSAPQQLTNLLYTPVSEISKIEDIDWSSQAMSHLRWALTHYRLGRYFEAKLALKQFEIADLIREYTNTNTLQGMVNNDHSPIHE